MVDIQCVHFVKVQCMMKTISIRRNDDMEIKLSCPRCGGTDLFLFKDVEIKKVPVDELYLYKENELKNKVFCVTCNLEDYVGNLELRIIE